MAKRKLKDEIDASEDKLVDVLDNALTAAEAYLKKFIPYYTDAAVKEAFERHVETHLMAELANIRDHGHRGDDPDFNPDA